MSLLLEQILMLKFSFSLIELKKIVHKMFQDGFELKIHKYFTICVHSNIMYFKENH